ncbi:MAG: tetratricopeptide repeat protein [Desulfobacteraceae bacterium]|nr:tetratricopeptide repeat protein [Desulfobacteraceae bacterium]
MTQTAEENFSHSYNHEVHIDGLETGTQYIYWIGNNETKYFFRTEPADVKPFSFLIEVNNLSDRISTLLISEMPEFILSFSSESNIKNDYYQSIKPYIPLYDLNGQRSNYLNMEHQLNETDNSWMLDWGGLSLIFINDASKQIHFLDSPVAHTIGIIFQGKDQVFTKEAIKQSELHELILFHNEYFPSNKIAFVFIPGVNIKKQAIDTINYVQIPLVENKNIKKTAAIRVDVNIETTYAVLLDTGDEITLKLPPLKENRTCEECRRLASTGAYEKSIRAYQEFIINNQGHFQIDDAYYMIADIMDTKLFQFEEAVEWYNKLLSGYPDSTLTPLAKQRLEYISKYADYNYEPLSLFERIRRVELLQSKNSAVDKDKVLNKTKKIIEQYQDAAIVPVIYYWLANQYRNIDIQKAKESYLTLLNKYPDHPYSKAVWWEIGDAYYDAKNYKDAIEAFNEALITIPASSDDIKAQITRAKRNLRRRHLNIICLLIPVFMAIISIVLPPVGIQFRIIGEAIISFVILLIIFSFASWLIAEQFSSITELIKITTGIAAAFTCGFPFSYVLANKVFRISNSHSKNKKIHAALFGLLINFICSASICYLTLYSTNEHYLTILNL